MTKHERMLAALDVYKNGDDKAEMSQLAAESAPPSMAELWLRC